MRSFLIDNQLDSAIILTALEDFWFSVLNSPEATWQLSDGTRHDNKALLHAIETLIASLMADPDSPKKSRKKKQHQAKRRTP